MPSLPVTLHFLDATNAASQPIRLNADTLAWPQFRGHHDRPQGEAGKNGAPWQTNGGNSRVSLRSRRYAA